MKTVLLTTSVAAAIGALSMGAANAAPIATHGTIVAPSASTEAACRTVKRTVWRGGVKRVTTTRSCSPTAGYYAPRRYYAPRPYYRPARPGITVRVN